MARHAKRSVKKRAPSHQKLVKAGRKMRKKRASRGLKTAAKRKKIRTAKRKKK